MRIRSVRPEFWTSEDIASLTWEQRLIYIGLWSYVDDNGVGRDVPKLIVADLFPLEESPARALKEVHGALTEYSNRGMITRYEVDGKPYFHIVRFNDHQVINRASKGRYPLPTSANAPAPAPLTEDSVSPPADDALGEGEKGRRGEVKNMSARRGRFDDFWAIYPARGKHSNPKEPARQKWNDLVKTVDPDVIIEAARELAKLREGEDPRHTPQAITWLSQKRFLDDPAAEERPVNGFFSPPLPPDDMPREYFSRWSRAHFEAHKAGKPGPGDWRTLLEVVS